MITLPEHLDLAGIDLANLNNLDIDIVKKSNGQLTITYLDLSFCLDLTTGNYRHRQQNMGKEPLLNALKIKGKLPQRVFDATPGVLKDTWMLAGRGIDVVTCERHPIIALLQYHALTFAQNEPAHSHITWQHADAKRVLSPEFLDEHEIDSVYLDPMYPHSPNSASVKKDLQLLQAIVGEDSDSAELLGVALDSCSQAQRPVRVVVKRPPYATPLANRTPSYESKTGKTRFDVYL